MNRSMRVLTLYLRERSMWFYLPWGIMLMSFAINVIIGLSIKQEQGMYTGGVASLYIYLLVAGIVAVSQTFPFLLGFGIRRNDYFLGTSAMVVIVGVVTAVLMKAMAALETATGHWGASLHFFDLPYLNDGPWYQQLMIPFALVLNMYYMGLLIGFFNRRFGHFITFTVLVVLAALGGLASALITKYDKWVQIGKWFASQTAFQYSLWALALAVVYAALSYLLLRRATA
ncbi:hypothetical protein ACFFSY_12510 [Paenibacillus aurantiacus]|uniref:ABC transporter permease n=1 Tax=Paenibacillus aurantiacus TaxID=1936118 RepID=A0ABV5KNE7_9BACL